LFFDEVLKRMNLPDLPLLYLTFRLQARESVMLPPFLGATLRGAFGNSLKKVFCIVPHRECQRCWFIEACPYQYIFESPNFIPKHANHPLLKGQAEVPQPFVLLPPNPLSKKNYRNRISDRNDQVNFNTGFAGNHFSAGESLEFSMILIGKATSFWAQVVVAVRLLAEYGLGEKRIPFSLVKAFAHDEHGNRLKVFDAEMKTISGYGIGPVSLSAIAGLRVNEMQNLLSAEKDKVLEIEFLTPTRIRNTQRNAAPISFQDIIRKITERLEFLAFLHPMHSQKIDYRPLTQQAAGFSVVSDNIKHYIFEQYSNAQASKTRRECFLGKISYKGDGVEAFLPFLVAGELLNVGANTSYGFGKYLFSIS